MLNSFKQNISTETEQLFVIKTNLNEYVVKIYTPLSLNHAVIK